MSDRLILAALQRETARYLTKEDTERLRRAHTEAFLKRVSGVRPLRRFRYALGQACSYRAAAAASRSQSLCPIGQLAIGSGWRTSDRGFQTLLAHCALLAPWIDDFDPAALEVLCVPCG